MLMTKGLMDRSLHQELALERVCEKAELVEEELFELRNWKVVMEQKLKLAERARDEYQKMTEELKKALEDKENDIRERRPSRNIVTPTSSFQSSKSVIMMDSMMHSVRPRLFIPSSISCPLT